MLFASDMCRAHHVPGLQRSRRGFTPQAAAFSDRILLSARQISNRRELRTVVRSHGRIQRKVSLSAFHYINN